MSQFNPAAAKWCIWGAKKNRDTFGHIHAGFLRALKYLGREAYWLDTDDNLDRYDFSQNTIFLSMNCVTGGLPNICSAWYVIHNAAGDKCQAQFAGLKLLSYGIHVNQNVYGSQVLEIGPDIYFDPTSSSLSLRWCSDLLPHEIDANKPNRVFNSDSKVVNYVGSMDGNKSRDVEDFIRACRENGISFQSFGGYNNGPIVTIEEHIKLIQDSYIAPAFQGKDQIAQGYSSCRAFKNISYGQACVTPSKFVNEIFGGRAICNPDTYALFYEARERLSTMPLSDLLWQMEEVKTKHTFLNKIAGIEKAIEILEAS